MSVPEPEEPETLFKPQKASNEDFETQGTKHTEVILTEQEFIDAIPEVIYAIESYDTTTVRASIGNYLLAKYISQHSEAKVIFNGDGSDELCGGYLYMNYASSSLDFDYETKRLLKDIHMFDVLRSDKSITIPGHVGMVSPKNLGKPELVVMILVNVSLAKSIIFLI